MTHEPATTADVPVRVLIMGAAGRDFHNFNVAFRDRADYRVMAFTSAQIPGMDGRTYPPSLAGPLYPDGVPIRDESELEHLIAEMQIRLVVFAYSDVSHENVMHAASRAQAAGADFQMLGPDATMLKSTVPVIAVTATRTGAGKSATSLYIAQWLDAQGYRVAILRHPMPYGVLERQAVQHFSSEEDMADAGCTVEEREEYAPYVKAGLSIYAGVDYGRILEVAQRDADVVLWDGGNNDFSFVRPNLNVVMVDPLRAGDGLTYHPGEINLRMADVCVISKAGAATPQQLEQARLVITSLNPHAKIALADLAIGLADKALVEGKRVVVVGDGPTLTHGGLATGAGTIAATRFAAAEVVDPRPFLVGRIESTFEAHPHLRFEIPAMGYDPQDIRDLEATLRAVPAETVLSGTPMDLGALLDPGKPIANVEYTFAEQGDTLSSALKAFAARHLEGARRISPEPER